MDKLMNNEQFDLQRHSKLCRGIPSRAIPQQGTLRHKGGLDPCFVGFKETIIALTGFHPLIQLNCMSGVRAMRNYCRVTAHKGLEIIPLELSLSPGQAQILNHSSWGRTEFGGALGNQCPKFPHPA